jgi:alpha-amylase
VKFIPWDEVDVTNGRGYRMKRNYLLGITGLLVSALLLGSCSNKDSVTDYQTTGEGEFSYENATVYFAMTDRFFDGDEKNNNSYGRVTEDSLGKNIGTFNGGDIKGLTLKLEEGYFEKLGINAIWITAPYEQIHGYIGGGAKGDFAHYGYHGYYALDWTMMDKNMGTVEEFRTFVDTAHSQGIRIIMDVVMNHVGYTNLQDMEDYDYGNVSGLPEDYTVKEGEDFFSYNKYVDTVSEDSFKNFWGDWVRADLPGYNEPGSSEITKTLSGLPDIRTDVTEDIGLAPILVKKWANEDDSYDDWILPSSKELRQDLQIAPYQYIEKWLAAWVEEFGIDGFRVDTAKHVEVERWKELSIATDLALKKFRAENPDNVAAKFEDDFFMVGEVWGHGLLKNYYFDNGFDALINFTFQGLRKDGSVYKKDKMDIIYKNYAEVLNRDDEFNLLNYISQHDTGLYNRKKLVEGGTYLMLLPGAVMVFYGDETARPYGDGGSDATQGTRSFMNWDNIDPEVLEHFQKLGQFRNRNIAVGAGEHTMLQEKPYVFMRNYNQDGINNTVLVYEGDTGEVTLDVSKAFKDKTTVRDAYTGSVYTVKDGKVILAVHEKGLALLEEVVKKD